MFCPDCGDKNLDDARFCGNCGAALAATAGSPPPASAPSLPIAPPAVTATRMGFWIRLGAWFLDGIAILAVNIALSLVTTLVGLVEIIGLPIILLPWLYYWLFTGIKGQTPGKMAVGIKVVDDQGNVPGLGRAALREIIGKFVSFVSAIALFLGFLWIAWDRQKQGWHDKIASTYVVRSR